MDFGLVGMSDMIGKVGTDPNHPAWPTENPRTSECREWALIWDESLASCGLGPYLRGEETAQMIELREEAVSPVYIPIADEKGVISASEQQKAVESEFAIEKVLRLAFAEGGL